MTTPTPVDPAVTASNIASDIGTIADDVAQAAVTVTTANAWTAVVGFFTALPGIVVLIENFTGWLNQVSGNSPGTLIAELGEAFSKLAAAKTEQEKSDASQNLSNLISRIPN